MEELEEKATRKQMDRVHLNVLQQQHQVECVSAKDDEDDERMRAAAAANKAHKKRAHTINEPQLTIVEHHTHTQAREKQQSTETSFTYCASCCEIESRALFSLLLAHHSNGIVDRRPMQLE